jgi:hypothetical protein
MVDPWTLQCSGRNLRLFLILSVGLLCLLYAVLPSPIRNGVSRFQPHWWPAAEMAAVGRFLVKIYRKHPNS